MATSTSTEADAMSKQPRTVHLPPEVYELADAAEYKGGAKFNRQVLIGLLRLYFTDPNDDSAATWHRLAIAVERGDLSIGDVPIAYNEGRIKDCEQYLAREDPPPNEAVREWAQRELKEAKEHLKWWKVYASKGDTPLKGIIQDWTDLGDTARYAQPVRAAKAKRKGKK